MRINRLRAVQDANKPSGTEDRVKLTTPAAESSADFGSDYDEDKQEEQDSVSEGEATARAELLMRLKERNPRRTPVSLPSRTATMQAMGSEAHSFDCRKSSRLSSQTPAFALSKAGTS